MRDCPKCHHLEEDCRCPNVKTPTDLSRMREIAEKLFLLFREWEDDYREYFISSVAETLLSERERAIRECAEQADPMKCTSAMSAHARILSLLQPSKESK